MIRFGIISATDPSTGRVRVQYNDADGIVTYWLPVLQSKTLKDKHYYMPDINEQVACMMDEHGEEGIVLGAIYSDADTTPISNQDKYHITFNDGTVLEYDRANHILTANVQGVANITAQTANITAEININGNVNVSGSMTVSGTVTSTFVGTVHGSCTS